MINSFALYFQPIYPSNISNVRLHQFHNDCDVRVIGKHCASLYSYKSIYIFIVNDTQSSYVVLYIKQHANIKYMPHSKNHRLNMSFSLVLHALTNAHMNRYIEGCARHLGWCMTYNAKDFPLKRTFKCNKSIYIIDSAAYRVKSPFVLLDWCMRM